MCIGHFSQFTPLPPISPQMLSRTWKRLPGIKPKVYLAQGPVSSKGQGQTSKSIKTTSTRLPFLGYSTSLSNLRLRTWKAKMNVFIPDQPLFDFCLMNLCDHIFHPPHPGYEAPQFISTSHEGPPSSIWFELVSLRDLLSSPLEFLVHAPLRAPKNTEHPKTHSPGWLIRAVKITRILSHSLQKTFLLYILVQCLPSFFWAPQYYSKAFTLESLHATPSTHTPFLEDCCCLTLFLTQ